MRVEGRLPLGVRLLLTGWLIGSAPAFADPAQAPPTSESVIEALHSDAVGTVRLVTDTSGAVVEQRNPGPFGEARSPEPLTEPGNPGFAGKRPDAVSGLSAFGARDYSALTGRFTSVDPVSFLSKSLTRPQDFNLYSYGLNNPFTYVDPDGRKAKKQSDVYNITTVGAISLDLDTTEPVYPKLSGDERWAFTDWYNQLCPADDNCLGSCGGPQAPNDVPILKKNKQARRIAQLAERARELMRQNQIALRLFTSDATSGVLFIGKGSDVNLGDGVGGNAGFGGPVRVRAELSDDELLFVTLHELAHRVYALRGHHNEGIADAIAHYAMETKDFSPSTASGAPLTESELAAWEEQFLTWARSKYSGGYIREWHPR